MVGLLGAAYGAASPPAQTCRPSSQHPADCAGQAMSQALTPYFKGAAIGAAVGLLVGALIVLTWKYVRGAKSGPFATTRPESKPRREALPERIRHEVWRRDGGTCVDCGSRARLEFDHIIPLSRGGATTVRNLEIRCEFCNRAKGASI